MKSRRTEETMCLLTGAALGAAALYFMDPNAGQRRRQRVAAAAEGIFGNAVGATKTGVHAVSSHAADLAARLAHHAQQLHGQAGEHAQDLADQAHDIAKGLTDHAAEYLRKGQAAAINAGHGWGSHLMDRARHAYGRVRGTAQNYADVASTQAADTADDWRRWAAHRVSRASHKAQSWLGHEEHEGFGAGALLTSTAGCWAVGAGMMYFLDPDRGRARRAWIVSKSGGIIRQTGRRMRGIGQHLANQLRGVAHESSSAARDYINQAQVDSELLVRRIRSAVDQFLPHSDQIQFLADADGTITVTGDIVHEEVDRLLTFLHGVPGVSHVINRLNARDAAENPTPSATPH